MDVSPDVTEKELNLSIIGVMQTVGIKIKLLVDFALAKSTI